MVRYCYDYAWLAWLLVVSGVIMLIVSLGQLVSSAELLSITLLKGLLFLLGGIALLMISHPALLLRARKGRSFLRYLWKATGGTKVQLKASDEE